VGPLIGEYSDKKRLNPLELFFICTHCKNPFYFRFLVASHPFLMDTVTESLYALLMALAVRCSLMDWFRFGRVKGSGRQSGGCHTQPKPAECKDFHSATLEC